MNEICLLPGCTHDMLTSRKWSRGIIWSYFCKNKLNKQGISVYLLIKYMIDVCPLGLSIGKAGVDMHD